MAYKKQIKRRGKVAVWETRYSKVLEKHHGHFAKKVFHRLMKKSATLKASLKKRSKEYEVVFNITLDEIRELFLKFYGKKCNFCSDLLLVSNIVCDHKYPVSLGGESTPKNLTIICRRCNTRKGSLTEEEYTKLLNFVNKQSDNMKNYILRKLAKGDMFT
tara:strand:- start:192 stop:671 length:480 start_codon:yes stop_codon:yes gene_type:complete